MFDNIEPHSELITPAKFDIDINVAYRDPSTPSAYQPLKQPKATEEIDPAG